MKTNLINNANGCIILTENVNGEMYLITADTLDEVVNDWRGDCDFVPENDAHVYFAIHKGRATVEPRSFEATLGYLMGRYGLT